MIAVDKRGRLGNQMFQYAFATAVAQRLGTFFAYDTAELEPYFALLDNRIVGAAKRRAVQIVDRFQRLDRREVEADDRQDPEMVLESTSDQTFYGGHFYSEGFFRPAAARIRLAFRVHDAHMQRFEARYASLLAGGYIAAHVRLTDFFTYRNDVTLPPGYYRRALELLNGDLPVVAISDEPERVRAAFRRDPRIRVEANDEIVDFLLLRHASHIVSSNSSFAWWAAWLNDCPGARVVAPRWWLGLHEKRELPVKAIPQTWEQLEPRCPGDGRWPQL